MWSPNEKVRSPKWENAESNFWHTYSFTIKYGIINVFYAKYTFKPKNVVSFCKIRPDTPYIPGLFTWNPLGDFCPQIPLLWS